MTTKAKLVNVIHRTHRYTLHIYAVDSGYADAETCRMGIMAIHTLNMTTLYKQ